MLVCIVCRRARADQVAPPGLVAAGAGGGRRGDRFLVLCFLFDVSSFPHTPYILLSLAGLLAVMLSEPAEERRLGPGPYRRPRAPPACAARALAPRSGLARTAHAALKEQRMRSLVLKMSVSLDGFVAPIDGSTDWVAAGRSDDGASWTVETLSNAGAHLIGATTYAGWAAYWPGASGPFAKAMNEIPKVVFSDSLASADWDETTIATGDLAAAITRLKQERSDGYLLAHGGVRFARSLVETGLIDEYRLVVHPVVLGAGERLFLAPLTLEPTSTTVFSAGAVAHVFTAHP